jgi:hypothetical protein
MSDKKPLNLNVNDLKFHLIGKLERVEKHDGQHGLIYESLVTLPAPDAYTTPPRFFVRSSTQLAKEGQQVDIVVGIKSRYWKANSGRIIYTPELWLLDEAA